MSTTRYQIKSQSRLIAHAVFRGYIPIIKRVKRKENKSFDLVHAVISNNWFLFVVYHQLQFVLIDELQGNYYEQSYLTHITLHLRNTSYYVKG